MKMGDNVSHKTSKITGEVVKIERDVPHTVVVRGESKTIKKDILHVDNGRGVYYGPRDEWKPAD